MQWSCYACHLTKDKRATHATDAVDLVTTTESCVVALTVATVAVLIFSTVMVTSVSLKTVFVVTGEWVLARVRDEGKCHQTEVQMCM